MRQIALVALLLLSVSGVAHAGNPEQAARMKACAEEWRHKQQVGTAKGDWRAFSKECLSRASAGGRRAVSR